MVLQLAVATAASGLIGAVTFWGSLVAFSKLQDLWFRRPVRFPLQQVVNAVMLFGDGKKAVLELIAAIKES